MNHFSIGVVALILHMSAPAWAYNSARDLLNKSRDFLASASFVSRSDTTEQSSTVIMGERRIEQKPQKNVITIEVDLPRQLVREIGTQQGKKLIILKKGTKAALKIGEEPWQTPSGPYEKIVKDLGNFFVCEIDTPETEENAPVWKLIGTEVIEGQEALIIESEGNTAVSIAQERMTKNIGKAYKDNPTQCPSIKVLEYSSKIWIGKVDYRHLQTIQTSKYQMIFSRPDGIQFIQETTSKGISKYNYEKTKRDIPEGAKKFLATENSPMQIILHKESDKDQ